MNRRTLFSAVAALLGASRALAQKSTSEKSRESVHEEQTTPRAVGIGSTDPQFHEKQEAGTDFTFTVYVQKPIAHWAMGYKFDPPAPVCFYAEEPSGNTFLGKTKPKNNQCPICGEMAEPYKQVRVPEKPKVGELAWIGPASNLTRCKHCNAAFFQDAE